MKEASPSGEASQGEIRGVSPQSPRACLAVTAFQTRQHISVPKQTSVVVIVVRPRWTDEYDIGRA